MPPPNQSTLTAVAVTTFPYTVTQSDIHDAGTTYTVYYKRVSDGTEGVVGMEFRGAGAYLPTCEVYEGGALLGTITANLMSQVPLRSGNTYYFKVIPNVGNPTPAVLTVNLVQQSRTRVENGDIFIRAASITAAFTAAGYTGIGGGIINPTTGIIKNFEPEFIPGEAGDFMPVTGEMLFADEFNPPFTDFKLYSAEFDLIATITQDWNNTHPLIRTCRETRLFMCMSIGTGITWSFFWTITPLGVKSSNTELTNYIGGSAAVTNPAGTLLYMAGLSTGGVDQGIKVWNIAGAAFDADLVPVVANYTIRDMLVMSNGDLVVLYHRSSIDDIYVKIFNSAGILQNTYTAPAVAYTVTAPRLCYGNDSISFWLFLHQSDGFSRFIQVRVSDVTVLKNVTAPSTDYQAVDQGTNPDYRLVTSDSCPMVLLLVPDASGLYYPNPNITHDIYRDEERKIPNPTIRTALIGE